ncbi:OpgC domain-containing protein, partial [Staphylococcus aureus]
TAAAQAAITPKVTSRSRDERLDFFRGITMFIIFIAHMPGNSWNGFIPARFGFSSGAELFVFCSGVASAIAFGGTFTRHGLLIGTARICYRI